jgi:hypothetical protein
MNRGIHEIAVLFNPNAPWTPWARQPQWNQKVLMLYGAGTSQVYAQSTPGSVLSNEPLSRGFAVATSSMMINSLHANFVTAAETTMMLKERIIETQGEIRYTIGEGAGRALLQHSRQIAPGAVERLEDHGRAGLEESIRRLSGLPTLYLCACVYVLAYVHQSGPRCDRRMGCRHECTNIETRRLSDYNQPDDGTNCAGADSYKAVTNPTGVLHLPDFMVSIFGRRRMDMPISYG